MLHLTRRHCLALPLAGTPLWSGRAGAQRPWLEVLVAEQGGAYDEVVAGLRRELAGVHLQVSAQAPDSAAAGLPQVVITLGVQALRAALGRSTQPAWRQVPVLAGLLPASAHALHAAYMPAGSSAVFLDQPPERLLALARLALPQRRRLGLLLGPAIVPQVDALMRAAGRLDLQLVPSAPIQRSQDIYPALSEVLGRVDALLALPDPLLFNPDTLQNILLATYRQRAPMLSYSAAHVRAGATLALYTTTAQVAQQLVQALRPVLAGAGLPRPALATDFTVAVNAQVGRSLGLVLPDATALEAALRRQEGRS